MAVGEGGRTAATVGMEREKKLQVTLAEAVRRHQAGDLTAARGLYLEVLAADPRHAACLHLLGLEEHQAGRTAVALRMFERAIEADGRQAGFHLHRGMALQGTGQYAEAIASYDRALALGGAPAELHLRRSLAFEALGDPDAALRDARQVLCLAPQSGEAWELVGRLALQQKDWCQAQEAWAQARTLAPRALAPLLGLARVFFEQQQWDEARACYDQALALDPAALHCWHDLGAIHTLCGRYEEAEQCFRRVLAADAGQAGARHQLALVQLLRGNFAEGLENLEARAPQRAGDPSRWRGEPLAGRSIFLYAEQGYGDTLQCVRFALQVERAGGRVVLGVTPPLVRLLQASFPAMTVVSETVPAEKNCALMSLPYVLGLRGDTIPAEVPYLKPPEEARAKARALVWEKEKLRVGLVWAGNPDHALDRFRSLPLEALRPLCAVDEAAFYSVQMGPGARQLEQSDLPIVDLRPQIEDMADTAALLESLDLLIAVDTSVLHLAGALGRPAWLLVPAAPDWRWQLGREDSPWYPTLRLFRQSTLGDWSTVVARMVTALRELVRERCGAAVQVKA